jgi:peroxiredoxin
MKLRYGHNAIKSIVAASLIGLTLVVWAGCRKKPAEPSGEGTSTETGKSLKPGTGLFTEPKLSLSEITKSAETWGPAYESVWGKPAPDLTVIDINGKTLKLSSCRGKDVLIVFWASYLGPCRLEIPDLIELRNTIGADKLVMLAISKEDASILKSFVDLNKINYTVVSASNKAMPSPFDQAILVPSSFFIDPQGRIKLGTVGKLPIKDIKAILQAG